MEQPQSFSAQDQIVATSNTLLTTDFDEITDAQNNWEVFYRPLRPTKFQAKSQIAYAGSVQIDLERYSSPIEIYGHTPTENISFSLPCNDTSSFIATGREVTAGMINVFGPNCELFHQVRPYSSLIACSISTEALKNRGNLLLRERLEDLGSGHKIVNSTRQEAMKLCLWLSRILSLFGRGTISVDAYNRLTDDLLLVVNRMLISDEEDLAIKARSRYLLARRARNYMLERQSNPPTVTEVCTFLKISERNLHYSFTESFGVAPKRFLKARRLFAAHKALKTANDSESVRDIALNFGFWELGYFARDYKAMFDELPSSTLRRAQA